MTILTIQAGVNVPGCLVNRWYILVVGQPPVDGLPKGYPSPCGPPKAAETRGTASGTRPTKPSLKPPGEVVAGRLLCPQGHVVRFHRDGPTYCANVSNRIHSWTWHMYT